MRVLRGIGEFRPDCKRPLILGLGNFDGLHVGHQALLKRVVDSARKQHGLAAVFTFRKHPQQILHPDLTPKILTSLEHKLYLLQESGVDLCFLISFDAAFASLEAAAFVEKILVKQLAVREVYMGYSGRFGHDRRGDTALMRELARKFSFHFEEIAPVKVAGEAVSSSRIRGLIEKGNLEEAVACLGRPFSILAKVVKGEGRGAGLGFPTANLDTNGLILPPEGVYPVKVRIIRDRSASLDLSLGVLNYGRRPTFDNTTGTGPLRIHGPVPAVTPVCEVFLLDFQGDLYGKLLEVVFYPRLRGEQRFENVNTLKQQIEADIQEARKFFSHPHPTPLPGREREG